MKETVILCADLVVFDEQRQPVKVLMIRRKWAPYEGAWALPGGHVDPGETFQQAAVREALEETGLSVNDVRQVGIYDAPERDPRGRVVSVAFTVQAPKDAKAVAGDDAAEVAWVPARQVISGEVPVAFDHQQIILDALKRKPGQ